ncbi:hypothetical protein BH23BAC3_BH23BAC3_19750 [soil metagenome]
MENLKSVLILFLVIFLVSGCSEKTLQEGIASWYGPGFHGQRTSSGEIYNENDTTAAHRSLPFDTIVRVINTENDKSVEVRINDRGPYVDGRIIDLSLSAAEAIDMLDTGTAPVRLELVEAGGNIPDDVEQRFYTIQVAEYNRPGYAESLAEEIGEEAQVNSDYRDDRSRYRVYYGWYDQIEKAREDLQLLNEKGYEGLIKQVN